MQLTAHQGCFMVVTSFVPGCQLTCTPVAVACMWFAFVVSTPGSFGSADQKRAQLRRISLRGSAHGSLLSMSVKSGQFAHRALLCMIVFGARLVRPIMIIDLQQMGQLRMAETKCSKQDVYTSHCIFIRTAAQQHCKPLTKPTLYNRLAHL